MEKIYTGKTKDVYKVDENTYELRFKDDVTGKDGVFDPGANHVGLKMEGAGKSAVKMTKFFYEKLNDMGINTHFISANVDENSMRVKKAETFGDGLEVIVRYKAVGSFLRRYGRYIEEGSDLPEYCEITIKDDDREDPLITEDALVILGLLTHEEYQDIVRDAKKIASLVKEELKKKNVELYDIKFEFGRVDEDRHIALIDEISGGNMRAYMDGKYVEPLKLEKIILSE